MLAAGLAALILTASSVTNCNAGCDLQAVINAASPGDTIVVQAGVAYPANLTLPAKSGEGVITIQSSRVDELPAGVRVGPTQVALMARLQSVVAAEPVVKTAAGAKGYRFIGIEFSTATAAIPVYDLVRFGEGRQVQTTLASVPHQLTIDRSYIHGWPTQDVQRGVAMNCADCAVIDSHISDIHGRGYDTQAICGWNGPGPFTVTNNYLEAAGENVLFGGADPATVELTPANITIQRNYIFKPLSWKVGDPTYAGIHWTIKNLLELKNARNVVIDGNVLENSWGDAQIGYAVLFTVRNQEGTAPWSTIENVQFTNNTVKNAEQGMQTLGKDSPNVSQQSRGLRIVNNLFTDLKHWGIVVDGFADLIVEHNTHFQKHNILVLANTQTTGFVYRNNLTQRDPNGYGVKADGTEEGVPSLNKMTPGWVFQGNVVAGAVERFYPTGNYYPATMAEVQLGTDYRLAPTSPFKGKATDGGDPGVNMDALLAAQGGTTQPTPTATVTVTPTSTPTPAPIPSPTSTPTVTPTPTPQPTATPTQPCPMTAWPSSASGQNQKMEQQRALGCYPVRRPPSGQGMEYARP